MAFVGLMIIVCAVLWIFFLGLFKSYNAYFNFDFS